MFPAGQRSTNYLSATALALLFHAVGLVGLLFFDRAFFLAATPFNLLLMLGLLFWTQPEKNRWFFLFFTVCFVIGLGLEITGVQTGAVFGQYRYGAVLGYRIWGTPLMLGVNWFLVIYGCGSCLYRLSGRVSRPVRGLVITLGGAGLATFYDWLMEPVAIRLGYWQWEGTGGVPLYNYVCWFAVSALLLVCFQAARFEKPNKFAVNLMAIQLVFFLVLRLSLT